MATSDAERALFTIKRGDDWRPSFTSDDEELSTWDDTTVFCQIRAGGTANEDSTLIATSDPEDGVATINVTADFTAGTLEFHIDNSETVDLPIGDAVLEMQVEVDGDLLTKLEHVVSIVGQVAVEAGS